MQHNTLPFFGLGFDLAPVLRFSLTLCFSQSIPANIQTNNKLLSTFPSGIELLIYLNRETRGS